VKIELKEFIVNKRFALTIARGTRNQNRNLWLEISADGISGWGEAVPFSIGDVTQSIELITKAIEGVIPELSRYHPYQRQQIDLLFDRLNLPSAARAGIDLALHDWWGKALNLPLWKLWGLDWDAIVPISVTVGISSPEDAIKRVRAWLDVFPAEFFKVKLGSGKGIDADKAMMLAIRAEVPQAKLTVDANGGWNLADAITMSKWLADLGVSYLEQPLARGNEANLAALRRSSPLPIFVDESCFNSRDIPGLAGVVDGVNLKLMKTGGLSETMRSIHTARACGLQVMFGCYSDTVLANTAAAHLSPLADYLDLDSHLNLIDDPFQGGTIVDGKLIPPDLPGLGVIRSS
jgi:L-Ala-D/L-Glu epimerase